MELDSALPQTTVMVVSVTGSTTSGQPLSEEDLHECIKVPDSFPFSLCSVFVCAGVHPAYVFSTCSS